MQQFATKLNKNCKKSKKKVKKRKKLHKIVKLETNLQRKKDI